MSATIVYAFNNDQYLDYATRFVSSYQSAPPGLDHKTLIVCNGRPVDGFAKALFSSMDNVEFIQHDNSGWDIGAFQAASRHLKNGLAIFFGASAFFTRPDWLYRVSWATQRYGIGIYGSMGNQGNISVNVWPHIRTTGFWLCCELFNQYPLTITQREMRHPFEHGPFCLCEWAKKRNLPRMIVGWSGEFNLEQCDQLPNGFQRGNQSNLIFRDRFTEPPIHC